MFLRPGVREFLEEAGKHFELIIYTAAAQIYADPIIDALENTSRLFSKRLYRQHCTRRVLSDNSEVYIKELRSVADRKYDSSMLVDDNWVHVHANEGRVLEVRAFVDPAEQKDKELAWVLSELLRDDTWAGKSHAL